MVAYQEGLNGDMVRKRVKKGVKFSSALYDFDAFMEVEKNLAAGTREAYRYDLERFVDKWIEWNGVNPTLDNITTMDIKRYLEFLRMDHQYKSTTLSRVIASIRVFYEFCVMQELVDENPAMYIHNPKMPKKLPIFLIEKELRKLLSAPPDAEQSAARRKDYQNLGKRDYAMLITMGFTGVRLMELVNLDLGDIDFDSGSIRVMGKGSKERIIPINEMVSNALSEWLEVRKPEVADDKAVFLNRFGRRISSRGVRMMVDKYVGEAGISKDHVSPHKLRHTFATLLHRKGVDILEIQALLGHSSITSTQVYTHASSEKLKSAVKKLEEL